MKSQNSFRTPFESISYGDRGIIIQFGKNTKNISFSELEKIYIQKKTLSFSSILILNLILLLAIGCLSFYFSSVGVFITSFLFLPLTSRLTRYKKYQLNVKLIDGTLFVKSFYNETKQDNINLVNVIRKKIFDNQIILNNKNNLESSSIERTVAEDYFYLELTRWV